MKTSVSSRKWKYAKETKEIRRCNNCFRRLKKDEAHICHKCYLSLIRGNGKVKK